MDRNSRACDLTLYDDSTETYTVQPRFEKVTHARNVPRLGSRWWENDRAKRRRKAALGSRDGGEGKGKGGRSPIRVKGGVRENGLGLGLALLGLVLLGFSTVRVSTVRVFKKGARARVTTLHAIGLPHVVGLDSGTGTLQYL